MPTKPLLIAFWTLVILLSSTTSFGQAGGTFRDQCASCHAEDGSGTPAGKKLGVLDLRSREVQGLSDEEIYNSIAYGVGHKKYPHGFARRGLTAQQITGLVAYIRTLKK